MRNCAYPPSVCSGKKEINFGTNKIHSCGECYQLLFLCDNDKCREANRALAQFCRICGSKISFEKEKKNLEETYHITASGLNENNIFFGVSLDELEVEGELSFYPFLSYGIVLSNTGKGVLLDFYSPENPVYKYQFPREEGIVVSPEFNSESTFFFTLKSIYKWNLLKNLVSPDRIEKIFPNDDTPKQLLGHIIYKKPVISGKYVFLFLARLKGQKLEELKYVLLDRDGNLIFISSLINEEDVSTPILLNHDLNKIFFFSENKLYLVDLGKVEFSLQMPEIPERHFDTYIKPTFFHPIIFIPGKNHIYVFNLMKEKPVPERFTDTPFSYKFLNEKLNLFIVKKEGACLARGGTGFSWDSCYALPRIDGPSDQFYPVHCRNVFGFVSLERESHIFSMVNVENQPEYILRQEFKGILSQPIIHLGCLFIIHLDEYSEKKLTGFRL